jgi:hypothetical protein
MLKSIDVVTVEAAREPDGRHSDDTRKHSVKLAKNNSRAPGKRQEWLQRQCTADGNECHVINHDMILAFIA